MIPKRLEILMVVVSEIFLCYWIYWYSKECLGLVGTYRAEMQMLIGLLECVICLMIYRWLVLNNKQGIYHRESAFLYSVVCLVFFLIADTLLAFFFRVRKKNAELRKKEEENYSDMRTYFLEHILPSGQNLAKEDQAIGKLSNIRQPDIKGLVYLKLINAFHEHLQVQVDLKEEITSIFMESEDLVRVLGIFLDNAIEAAKETEEKYLYLGFLSAEDGVYIRIENSMLENPIDLTQLCKYGYSTKGNNRGVGLYGVEQILAKYSNVLQSTEQKGKRFVQELKICRREL